MSEPKASLRERTEKTLSEKVDASAGDFAYANAKNGAENKISFASYKQAALNGPPIEFAIQALKKAEVALRSAGLYEAEDAREALEKIEAAK